MKRGLIRRVACTSGAAVLGAGALLGVSSATAEARSVVGGIVVDAACVYQYRTPAWATLYESNANGWQCISNEWKATDHRSVDMSRECRRTFGGGAYADYLDFNDPSSWRCFIDSPNF